MSGQIPPILPNEQGFTFVEVLVASLILTVGLVSVAYQFAYSARVTLTNQQRVMATILVHEKLEQLKFTPSSEPTWNVGSYSQERDGYLQVWIISGTSLRTVETVVYGPRIWNGGARLELARARATVAK